ncbi:MAG: folate-binding protein YgfZ [Rhodocyclales bacterium]|nr:folate-binding protein YgfZ [Rhodocyclales bacterium]
MTTPWMDYLAQEGALADDNTVRFPASGGPGDTVAVPLVHLGLIVSRGEDSAPFLHNLFSNDVKKLAPDQAQWNSFNSPKGRMLASMLVWPQGDGHALVMAADIHPAILKKLSMYVLRSKVKLSDGGVDTVLIGVTGAQAERIIGEAGATVPGADMHQSDNAGMRCIRLGEHHYVLAVAAADATEVYRKLLAAGAAKGGSAQWQLAMIRAGLPLVTAATQEEFVAQMINYELIGGVSFTKGCYPGQEIVARTRYLGKLKKRMYRVRIEADQTPQPGADIFTPEFGDQSAGKIVNAAPSPAGGYEALAVMQISCAEAGLAHLGEPAGPRLTVLDLPYALPQPATEKS